MRHIWIRTFSDGLVRADQVVGISAHRTPSIVGKPSRWLLDIALAIPAGSGTTDGWDLADLHRTILQTDWEPRGAAESLARLLHQLSGTDKAGVIRTTVANGQVTFHLDPFDESEAPGAESDTSGDATDTPGR